MVDNQPQVIWEDEQVMVINKPAGMVVNRAETTKEKTLQDWVEERWGTSDVPRSGIVHRLDKETSGVMIIAKSKNMFAELQRQFKKRETYKEYVALVHGKLEPKEGVMALPLGRSRQDRQKFTVVIDGKMAETAWKVEQYVAYNKETLTWVRLFPKTGRTHQLRVHLKHLGHPIVGDDHYLNDKRLAGDRVFCPRMFLHARKLCVFMNAEKRCFEVNLPKDLEGVLGKINIYD